MMAFDQGYADALAEAATLRQELDDTRAELDRLAEVVNGAIRAAIAIQANVAEVISRPQGSIDHGKRAYAALTLLADDLRSRSESLGATDRVLRTAARHVVDCYRHDNLMGVIVGVDKLAGLVDP